MAWLVVELINASKSSFHIQEVLKSSRKFIGCIQYFVQNYILSVIQKYLVEITKNVWNLK